MASAKGNRGRARACDALAGAQASWTRNALAEAESGRTRNALAETSSRLRASDALAEAKSGWTCDALAETPPRPEWTGDALASAEGEWAGNALACAQGISLALVDSEAIIAAKNSRILDTLGSSSFLG